VSRSAVGAVHWLTYDETLPPGRKPRPDDDEPAGLLVRLGLDGLENEVALVIA